MEQGIRFKPKKGKFYQMHNSNHAYNGELGEWRSQAHEEGHHSGGDGALDGHHEGGGSGGGGGSEHLDNSDYKPQFESMAQQIEHRQQANSIQTASLGHAAPVPPPVEEAPAPEEPPAPEETPEPEPEEPNQPPEEPPQPPEDVPPPSPPASDLPLKIVGGVALGAAAIGAAALGTVAVAKAIHSAVNKNKEAAAEDEPAAEEEGEEEGEEEAEEEAADEAATGDEVMEEAGLSAETMAMVGAGALGVAALGAAGLLAAGMMAGMMSQVDMLRKKKEMLEDELAIEHIVIEEFEKYLDELKEIKNEFGLLAKNTDVATDQLCNYFNFTKDQMTETLQMKQEDEEDMVRL